MGEASGEDETTLELGLFFGDTVGTIPVISVDGDTLAGFSKSFFQAAVCDNSSRLLDALGIDAFGTPLTPQRVGPVIATIKTFFEEEQTIMLSLDSRMVGINTSTL